MIPALLLEPDPWRFRGLSGVLLDSGRVEVIGEEDYAKILTLESGPEEVPAEVILLAHRLMIDYGVSIVAHLKNLFGGIPVLVHGDLDSNDITAQVLAVGASGYFLMSAPPGYLHNAVSIVTKGKLWAPREAIEMMARRAMAAMPAPRRDVFAVKMSDEEMTLLRMLLEGLANKEMAQRLGVAEVTIKARLNRLYKSFGVNTRLQLLSAAIRQGILPAGADPD